MLDRLFIFQPSSWAEKPYAQLSGLPLQDIWLSVDADIRLFGWYVDAGPNRPVLLWCHGNAGNISHRLPNLNELYRRGLSIMIFDYRGYGKSTGTPSEAGLYQDALAAHQFLVTQKRVDPQRLILFGRSLGTSVAAEVARQRPAAGLILEGAFPSIQSMADHHYFGLPSHWFVDAQFNLVEKLSDMTIPLFMIHGEHDTIVPIKLGKHVFTSAHPPKKWLSVRGAGHNDVPFVGGNRYFQELLTFIQQTTAS